MVFKVKRIQELTKGHVTVCLEEKKVNHGALSDIKRSGKRR